MWSQHPRCNNVQRSAFRSVVFLLSLQNICIRDLLDYVVFIVIENKNVIIMKYMVFYKFSFSEHSQKIKMFLLYLFQWINISNWTDCSFCASTVLISTLLILYIISLRRYSLRHIFINYRIYMAEAKWRAAWSKSKLVSIMLNSELQISINSYHKI